MNEETIFIKKLNEMVLDSNNSQNFFNKLFLNEDSFYTVSKQISSWHTIGIIIISFIIGIYGLLTDNQYIVLAADIMPAIESIIIHLFLSFLFIENTKIIVIDYIIYILIFAILYGICFLSGFIAQKNDYPITNEEKNNIPIHNIHTNDLINKKSLIIYYTVIPLILSITFIWISTKIENSISLMAIGLSLTIVIPFITSGILLGRFKALNKDVNDNDRRIINDGWRKCLIQCGLSICVFIIALLLVYICDRFFPKLSFINIKKVYSNRLKFNDQFIKELFNTFEKSNNKKILDKILNNKQLLNENKEIDTTFRKDIVELLPHVSEKSINNEIMNTYKHMHERISNFSHKHNLKHKILNRT